jgi:ribose transport system substrate-binding protein
MICACATETQESTAVVSASAGTDVSAVSAEAHKVGIPLYNMGHRYWVDWLDELEKQFDELGIEVVSTDSKYDAAKQLDIMEDMIAQGCDVILLCPVDPSGVGVAIEEAEEAGVRVILSDLDVENDAGEKIATGYIGYQDMVEQGRIEGEWAGNYVKEHLGGKAKVAVLSYPVEVPCLEAEEGFLAGLKAVLGEENVETIIQNGQCNQEEGMTVTENILSAYPDINVVWGANDECALGGLAAMEAHGKTADEALVCGFYTIQDVMQLIKSGESMFKVSMYLPPRNMADAAVEMIMKVYNGETFDYETKVGFTLCDITSVDSMM